MGAATAAKDVLKALKDTTLGRKLASEVEAAESIRDTRVAALAKLDEGLAEREQLPKLAEAVDKAEAKYRAEMNRLSAKLAEARRAYSEAAGSSSLKQGKGEGQLRRTAHPMVQDNGPVVSALRDAIRHLRSHLLGTDEDRLRRAAKLTPLSTAPEDTKPLEDIQAMVRAHDEAMELIDAFRFALDELRDQQLEIDADPAVARDILEALPGRCVEGCHRERFTFDVALRAALEPKEVR